MKKSDLARFKKLLQEKRDNLLEKSRRIHEDRRATVNEGGEDYVDDAVSSYTREFLLSLSDIDRRTLNLVLEALERIEDGTYGECLMSGEDIPLKRLEAIPWARYTADCQEMIERQEMADLPLRDFAKDIEDESDEGDDGNESSSQGRDDDDNDDGPDDSDGPDDRDGPDERGGASPDDARLGGDDVDLDDDDEEDDRD